MNSHVHEAKASYRLGYETFSNMLYNFERIDIDLHEILVAGQSDLEFNYSEYLAAAKNYNPELTIEEITNSIRQDHPLTDELISETTAMLRVLRKFLIEKDFVTIPSDVLPKVIHTPKPFRKWAFAAMDTPGPLETKATDSYYYITPPEEEWTEQEKKEWLETFNRNGLLDISAHEAFPGHYLHHLHNQNSASIMSKLFGAYHFWEGYALYVEEAMWQAGFQSGDYKYRMAQLTETLLRNVRLIVAIKLHTEETFSLEEGILLFMKYSFLGRKPAESEAKRATYDPGYLNYAIGKLMIEKLRKDYQEENPSFSLKQFHDELLSFGAPPVPILRRFMLKNAEMLKNSELM